jgi:uncharacterized protein YqhQ
LQSRAGDDDEHPQDVVGCFWSALRFGCSLSFLYITMFVAILVAAIVSLIFFR